VVKGRINHFVTGEAALSVGHCYMADFTPPPFDEADDKVIRLDGPRIRPERPVREFVQLATDERYGPLDFKPASECAGETVARLPGGDRKLSEPEYPRREVLADIILRPAGSSCRTDHAECHTVF